jgi:outer membrane immunogenic protein
MKKLAIALTALAALTAPAMAADMPMRAPVAAAPVPVAPTWTGFWISGGFGYGVADIEHSVTSTPAAFQVFDIGHDNGARGWLGKVGVGYDFQGWPWSSVVIGGFADVQWSDISGNYSFNCPGTCLGPTGYTGSLKNDWSWAVGGRIGYIAVPGLLTYVNGGWTEANFTRVNYFDAGTGAATGLALPNRRRDGWFLGGGTEYSINWLPGLFWKSEYRFADFGNDTQSQLCVVTTLTGCGVGGTIHSVDQNKAHVQTITTELVYRFNWGGSRY